MLDRKTTQESEGAFISENGTYRIDKHQYPSDLSESTNNKYGNNKVVFFINTQGASKISNQADSPTIDLPKYRYISNSGNELRKVAPVNTIVTKPNKRLTTAISLYVPESVVKSYGVDWSMDDGESSQTGELMAKTILAGIGKGNNQSGSATENLVAALKTVGAAGGAFALGQMDYISKATGLTPGNSKASLLFRGVEFGGFTFDYKFAPKSEEEAEKVLNIIRTFRHHMLPEFLDPASKYIYIFPSEFEVRYYIGSEENKYLEHHITAVLFNMNVNYTPNGQYTTFANGMPTHINMTLQFKELGTPHKDISPSDKSGA